MKWNNPFLYKGKLKYYIFAISLCCIAMVVLAGCFLLSLEEVFYEGSYFHLQNITLYTIYVYTIHVQQNTVYRNGILKCAFLFFLHMCVMYVCIYVCMLII